MALSLDSVSFGDGAALRRSGPPPRRILGVFPHPDDESWAAGGLLAACAQAGLDVRLLVATFGEAGALQGEPAASPHRVAQVRKAELAAAASVLGARLEPSMGWPDGGLPDLCAQLAVSNLRARISALSPDVVVTLGPDGGYGHRDHLCITRWVGEALVGTATPLWWTAFPRGHFKPLWRRLRRMRDSPVASESRGDALGVQDGALDLTLELGPLADLKSRAIACHRSQLGSARPQDFLLPDLMTPLLRAEAYQLAPSLGDAG